MTSLTSFRGLAAVIGICVAIAQTPPAAPSGAHDASPIPLAEAEAHFLQHEVPAYPPLAKAARIEGTVHLVLRVDSQGVVAVLVEDVPPNQPLPESGPAKATASGCLPWRSHHQEERIQSAVWARSYRALSKEY